MGPYRLPKPIVQQSTDEDWLRIASETSWDADCTRRRVGAVIVRFGHVVATGFNRIPGDKPQCTAGGCPRGRFSLEELPSGGDYSAGDGKCFSVHAEAMAIIRGDQSWMMGSTMYCTCEPCFGCRKLIAEAGISRVVWPEGEYAP